MEKITLKDKTFRKAIPYEKISTAIDKVADKLNADFKDSKEPPVLLCVLNGSIMFMAELMKRLNFNCQVVSTKLTSYEGTSSTGKVKQAIGLTADIAGRNVIIVEDIIDTGRTLALLKEQLWSRGPKSLKICTAFDKPSRRVNDLVPDYNGITIPDEFIVGYGLDLDGEYRNFDDVRIVRKE